jgi:hypothetical protein
VSGLLNPISVVAYPTVRALFVAFQVLSFDVIHQGPVRVSLGDLVLLGVLVGWAIRWSHGLRHGSVVRGWWLGLEIVAYSALSFWVWLTTYISWNLIASGWVAPSIRTLGLIWFFLTVATVFVGGRIGSRLARNELTVDRSTAGSWLVRGAIGAPVLWLVLWLVRMALEDGLLYGYSVFLPIQAVPAVSALTFFSVVFAVGELYLLGFGTMMGFSWRTWRLYRARKKLPTAAWSPQSGGMPGARH